MFPFQVVKIIIAPNHAIADKYDILISNIVCELLMNLHPNHNCATTQINMTKYLPHNSGTAP